MSALADGNHQGFHRPAQILQISLEIVVLRGRLLGGVTAFGYGLRPLVDTGLAGFVKIVGGLDGVAAEDGRVRLVALLVGQAFFGLLQLPCEIRHADEMALRVIGADTQFLHRIGGFGGRRGQLHQHAVQLCAGFGADGAVLREQGKNAGGLLNVHAETIRLRAAIVQRLAEIGDIADGLACACGERIGHLGSLRPLQMEHAQRVGHVFGGIPHGHSIGRGQIQSARQAACEDIRDAHAGLAEIVDRVGGIRSGIDGRCACFDGGGTQLVHLGAGRAGVRLHGAHLLVEVCGHLHRSHAESGHGQTCCGHTAGDERGLATGVLHARSNRLRGASGTGHRRLI